ncbi:hypothetical protein Hypma_015052 [Hypsizygus marmoreus]|uniref:Uncharacterized protein n=1 Tax=Hypsizygus marmoreus TaxID=39966 RepID=A0A369K7F9_HYPMA|nr:hypothetical protein Hypma_015052 [Hypsizygus marmoreus]
MRYATIATSQMPGSQVVDIFSESCVNSVNQQSLFKTHQPSHNNSDSSLTHENVQNHNDLQSPDPKLTNEDSEDDVEITVENADSSSQTSSTPSSSPDLETPDGGVDHTPFPSAPDTDTDTGRPSRVHFRPRVRITSGISRHPHKHSPHTPTPTRPLSGPPIFSPPSSRSSSPSSSISAPLRSRSEDELSKPGWGTLGQRVGLLSHRRRAKERKWKKRYDVHIDNCERTPLLSSRFKTLYIDNERSRQEEELLESDRQEEERLNREIDRYFGTWPGRLLNHHWWWWQFEPLVCCHCGCLDDSDTE